MNKIIDYIKNQDNSLLATIILFIAGLLVGFLGAILIAVTSAVVFAIFGGLVVLMGVIIVGFGFQALYIFLEQL